MSPLRSVGTTILPMNSTFERVASESWPTKLRRGLPVCVHYNHLHSAVLSSCFSTSGRSFGSYLTHRHTPRINQRGFTALLLKKKNNPTTIFLAYKFKKLVKTNEFVNDSTSDPSQKKTDNKKIKQNYISQTNSEIKITLLQQIAQVATKMTDEYTVLCEGLHPDILVMITVLTTLK